MSTVAADDQTTHEIRANWQAQPPGTPAGWRWTRVGKPGLKYHARRAKHPHWLLRWIIEVAAVTIALTMTAAMIVFAYPVLTELIGSWGIIVSTIVGLGFGIVVTWCALELINR